MASEPEPVVFPSTAGESAEERMLRADLVSEMVTRKDRGEGIKQIARELGVDRKTVKRWLRPQREQRKWSALATVCNALILSQATL